MKHASILLFLFISLFSYGQNLDVFLEQYDDNANEWPISSTDKKTFRMSNGKYTFISKQSNMRSIVYKDFLVDRHSPFLVEASIEYAGGKKGERYGLLLGWFNWNNYAAFEVDQKGRFTIYQVRNGKRKYLAEEQPLGEKPSGGFDLFQVKKADRRYEFYFNNSLVSSYNDLDFIGTKFGYILNDKQEINVDFIQIQADNINVKIDPILNGQLENLGSSINSAYTEKSPIVSADGKTMYYTVQGDPNLNITTKRDDAVWSRLDARGNWTPRELLPGQVNNRSSNFLISIAPDENHAYFGNVYNPDGSMSKGLSEAYKVDGEWTLPTQVQIKGFSNAFPQVNYCVANSGRVLLMAIESRNSVGGLDLYVSFRQPDWTWSEPRNCGSVINTFANEMTPFLSADDKTLYFSSYGHKGFGSADIFMTRRLDDSWTNWTAPVNVGSPINGPYWDAYFKVDAKGEYGYMVSTAKGGYGEEDIYRMQLADEIRPEEVVLIQGKVFDSETGEELSCRIGFEDLHANVSLGEGWAQKGSGYAITLPKGRFYGFQANLEGYIPTWETIELYELDDFKTMEVNLYLNPIKDEQEFSLLTLKYERNQVAETSHYELDRLAETMIKNPTLVIDIDIFVAQEKEAGLLKQKALKQYLIQKGVNPDQLIYKGKTGNPVKQTGKMIMKLK